MFGTDVVHAVTGAPGRVDGERAALSPFDGGIGPWAHVVFDDGLTCWCPTSELVTV